MAEVLASAAQVKAVMPQIPITIFTDQPVESSLFENILILENPRFSSADKILALKRSPYERSLFLDTDIHVIGDISDVFVMLDQFDIALAHDLGRMNRVYKSIWGNVPYGFSQLNSGLIALKKSQVTDDLLVEWDRLYDEFTQGLEPSKIRDQPALRQALYYSRARLATLPPEYNFRPTRPGYCNGPVKVVHGRGDYVLKFAEIINKTQHARIVMPRRNGFFLGFERPPLWQRILRRLKQTSPRLKVSLR